MHVGSFSLAWLGITSHYILGTIPPPAVRTTSLLRWFTPFAITLGGIGYLGTILSARYLEKGTAEDRQKVALLMAIGGLLLLGGYACALWALSSGPVTRFEQKVFHRLLGASNTDGVEFIAGCIGMISGAIAMTSAFRVEPS